MKNTFKILALVALTALAASCFKDDRNNFLPDESIYLLNEKELVSIDVAADSIDVVVVKSGKGLSECDVTIALDTEALAAYNEANDEEFESLADNVFTISETSVHFSKEDFRKIIRVKWDSRAVSALLTLKPYVIPLSIQAEPLEVKEGRSTIIIQPVK